ncbi:MAG: YitT family protein [Lachnospiraceae bacterium]|nr:YitT family protein [Lachnospiraceae bacterium]
MFNLKEDGKKFVIIMIAAFFMAVNIKTFVRTGGLYPGGATGLTILIQRVAKMYFDINLPYSLINILMNAFPVYIGFRFIGKKFTIFSCMMIVMVGVFTDLIPGYIITEDILLISIFGGMINGFFASLCLNTNATAGGTDFIAIYLSEKLGMDSFNMILGFNAIILLVAGYLFGWDKALYSIIFQYASTVVIHHMYKKYQQGTLFIVTNKPNEICDVISRVTNHSATILEGEGSYEHCERNVVYSVVSRAETRKLMKEVKKVDKKAFVNLIRTEELAGRFYYRPEE